MCADIINFSECKYGMLNRKDAIDLFYRESFLIGQNERIPLHKVENMFGGGVAANVPKRYVEQATCGTYGVSVDGELYSVEYLTLDGFLEACTWHNLGAYIRQTGIEPDSVKEAREKAEKAEKAKKTETGNHSITI